MQFKVLFLFLLFSTGVTLHAQTPSSIRVNDPADPETNLTAEELIQQVLISGDVDCVDIELTNLAENPAGATNLAQRSWGYFHNNGTSFPFEEGIILTSGYAVNAEGPNDTSSATGSSWAGDADLQAILDAQYGTTVSTNDATVFEFTFTSALDEVAFDFIFASEEYENNFECSDNLRDGFAFLISGPGIADETAAPFGGVNFASIPNTNVPVSTATIHADYFELCGDEIQNQNYFPLYYVSNWDSADGGNNNTNEYQYDGRTISLTARVDIIPGEEYTMKLVIADRGDSGYDSAVFFRAGSFDIGDADLGGDVLLTSGEANCEGDIMTLSSGPNNPNATYIWYKDGVEIPFADSNNLEVSTTGTYKVEVYYTADCVAEDEVLIEFFPNPELDLGADDLVCPDNPVILDATPSNPEELENITYEWYIDGVLQSETSSTFTATEAGEYTVEVTGNQCMTSDSVTLNGVDFTVDLGDPISPCGVDSYTITPDITMNSAGDLSTATYMWSTGETTESIEVTENGDYWVDITIEGCTQRGEANVLFREIPVADFGEDFSKCVSETVQIDATPSNVTDNLIYTWYHDEDELTGNEFSGAVIEVLEPGTYRVEIDNNGCLGSEEIVISNYPMDNCVIPQGISPNGDNFNDCVDLQFLSDELGIENFKVYNRHGRLIFEMDNYVDEFCGNDQDGNELPTGTYYYVLQLSNSNQVYEQTETGWIYINREN